MKNRNIDRVMKILEKGFKHTERTTLNNMRNSRDNNSAFKILISCLLSLRTQDKNTKSASEKLFSVADSPEKISKLPIKKIEKLIYSSGHYKKKAKIIRNISKRLIKEYNGEVPDKKEELLKLKGVGPKTANIVLGFAYNKRVLPIDTHCHRIPNRIGWIKTKKPEETEKELEKILPKKYWREFNGIFVLFGKTICKPISPLCSKCPIEEYCKKTGVKRSR